MLQLRIGIQLSSLGQPFKKALLTAARLGAQAVEIDARGEIQPREMTRTAVRQVRKMRLSEITVTRNFGIIRSPFRIPSSCAHGIRGRFRGLSGEGVPR